MSGQLNPGRKARAEIDTASSGNNTIISAAGAGTHIEIDFLQVIPTGGANTLTFYDGSTQMFAYALDDNQAQTFDNASGDYSIDLSDNQAFVLNLSAATQVSGFVIYRVVGQ